MAKSGVGVALRGLTAVLVSAVLGSCAPMLPTEVIPGPTTILVRQTPSAEVFGVCPKADPGPVAATSILAPGPGPGVPPSTAQGDRLTLLVTVLDAHCQPVPGASVDVWHTDGEGVYGPGDGTPELQCCYYQGTIRTDEQGRFLLRTVRPGQYLGDPAAPPAHIHIDIRHAETRGLMTEIVFAGDPALPSTLEGHGLIVAALKWETDSNGGYWSGAVTVVLAPS